MEILKSWYNLLKKTVTINENTIIYLRTTPEIAYQRMKQRDREVERNIPKTYLETLNELYDSWLLYAASEQPKKIIILNGNLPIDEIIAQLE